MRIERARIDGRQRSAVITSGLQNPQAIAVDVMDDLIFWTDSDLKVIESSDLDGKDRKILLKDDSIGMPISLEVLDQYLIWIDSEKETISRINKLDGSSLKMLKSGRILCLCLFTFVVNRTAKNKTCVINDPLGQTHSSDHFFNRRLFCQILKSWT